MRAASLGSKEGIGGVRNELSSLLALGAVLRGAGLSGQPVIQVWSFLSFLGFCLAFWGNKPYCKPLKRFVVTSEVMWIIAVTNIPDIYELLAKSVVFQWVILIGFILNCLAVIMRSRP